MRSQFAYPAKITKEGNIYVITFRDVKEAITQAYSEEEIESAARDALETAAEIYMEDGKPFPLASAKKGGERFIELSLSMSAKIALHNSMLKNNIRQADIARKMQIPSSEVARIVNPKTRIKIDTLASAIKATGGRISIAYM